MFEGKTLIVCVDSDENTILYIADDSDIEKFYEEEPDGDRFALANAVGRDLTADEMAALPEIFGALTY